MCCECCTTNLQNLNLPCKKEKKLSEREKGKIDAYVDQHLTKRDIARRIRRSVTAVTSYLIKGEAYGRNYKGKKSKLSNRNKRQIARIARNKKFQGDKLKMVSN